MWRKREERGGVGREGEGREKEERRKEGNIGEDKGENEYGDMEEKLGK